jgi:RNA polymerase sigma-70 factor (ECF subfamily)
MRQTDSVFEEHRPALARLAYRMLGSLSDADDVVQESYLRWTREDRTAVKSPRAYLASIVTRLCIDQRQAVDGRKMTYVGPWLPEPVVEPGATDPSSQMEAAESVSMALLVVLESLSPVERAAYLLRRVFDYGYDEISKILDKSEANCRQLVSRAEERIRERRPRFEAEPAEAQRLAGAFLQACSSGDLDGLVSLLATDAVLYSDGGGKATAALVPIRGADRIAKLFLGFLKKAPTNLDVRWVRVNGQPGIVAVIEGQVVQVLTFDILDGRIATCFVVRNPDKLARIGLNGTPPGSQVHPGATDVETVAF